MRNGRFYYQSSVGEFLETDADTILGMIVRQDGFSSLQLTMRDSWREEIAILKQSLREFHDGLIVFE